MIKKQIPNTITLLNLLCGILAIHSLYSYNSLLLPSIFILLGALLDFFDGFAARLLKVSFPIGKELDSLADVVTFGVAPSLIMVQILQFSSIQNVWLIKYDFLTFIPLLMALMSAYRLAKFNLDERQTMGFIGVPTPANALIWLSVPIIVYLSQTKTHLWGLYNERLYDFISSLLVKPSFVIIGSVLMSVLLVSELPLIAMKFKNFTWKDNKEKFIFLIISLLLIFALNFYAIPFIVILYIIISLIFNTIKK